MPSFLIKTLLEVGCKMKITYFWSFDSPLSPYRLSSFDVDGATFPSLMHYINYRKAKVFKDEEALKAIMEAKTPFATNDVIINAFDAHIWENALPAVLSSGIKQKVMFHAFYCYFWQNLFFSLTSLLLFANIC